MVSTSEFNYFSAMSSIGKHFIWKVVKLLLVIHKYIHVITKYMYIDFRSVSPYTKTPWCQKYWYSLRGERQTVLNSKKCLPAHVLSRLSLPEIISSQHWLRSIKDAINLKLAIAFPQNEDHYTVKHNFASSTNNYFCIFAIHIE